MIVCKEVLQAAGPVNATGQKTKHTLLVAHVAVPRVLLDGRVCCPLADEEVDTFHTKTPTQEQDTPPQDGLGNSHIFLARENIIL